MNKDYLDSLANAIVACKFPHDTINFNPYTFSFTPIKNKLVEKVSVPIVKRIIHSGNKTIVLWEDGTKTIVGCSEGEIYDEFDGFTAALAKKIYGSTCAVKREIRKKSKHQ